MKVLYYLQSILGVLQLGRQGMVPRNTLPAPRICRGESEVGMLIEIGSTLSIYPGPECFTASALKKEFHIHPSRYHVVRDTMW